MSEKAPLPLSHETVHESYEHVILDPEHELPAGEKLETLEANRAAKLEEARAIAEHHSTPQENPLEKLQAHQAHEEAEPSHLVRIDRELEHITERRELQNIRRSLPTSQRAFSRLIHQPTIRVISEVASSTVSRPSGLLGGGLVALIGSVGYLYLAKHIGFQYNYFIFILLFVGGFVVGVLLEILIRLVVRPGHRTDS